MIKFEVGSIHGASVWTLYRMSKKIQVNPEYQRQGEVWTMDKRQLLIDTLINKFDIPKIYLHKFAKPKILAGAKYDYAIVDGRQRLETMWSFIEGKIALSDEFEYFHDTGVDARSMTYQELATDYPDLKTDLDNFQLNVITIETDDTDLIEEMFSRLNEAVPLTAAERRNAWAGPVPGAVRELSATSFFKKKLPFLNKRYRHFDLALKFLVAQEHGAVVDTKKAYLDRFVKDKEDQPKTKKLTVTPKAKATVAAMSKVFTDGDVLLRSIGMVMLYFYLFRIALDEGWTSKVTRQKLLSFDKLREKNREVAEVDIAKADYDLIEFDRYSQSPNDSYAVKFRLKVLLKHAFNKDRAIESL
ncbi:MAG: DUF262 domain-containing protein [Polaromonas sp.]|nr:DUF262 domain-containing protein [Polaromonas sp.]